MLATHQPPVKFSGCPLWLMGVLGLALVCGCGDPGPRALLKGDDYLKAGQFEKALEQFQTAVRLLPNTAQAWNHLGLAHHQLHQSQEAFKAYNNALMLDNKLAAARFNLGCLLLEQGNPKAAVEDLTSFTMLHPGSIDGWLQLGSAQRLAGSFDAAERSYRNILELEPGHAAALNGLGLVQKDRRRPLDALQYFNEAVTRNPAFAPALYNAAVVSQIDLNNRRLALEKYRQYLALSPRPKNWEEVSLVTRELEFSLERNPLAPTSRTNPVALASNTKGTTPPVRSNAPPPLPPTAAALNETKAKPLETSHNNKATPVDSHEVTRPPTNATPSKEIKTSTIPTVQIASNTAPVKATPPPKIENQKPEPPARTNTPPAAREPARAPSTPTVASAPGRNSTPQPTPPATGRTQPAPTLSPAPPSQPVSEPRATTLTRPPASAGVTSAPVSLGNLETNRVRPPAPLAMANPQTPSSVPRYKYRHPAAPPSGDRDKAEAELNEGMKWHRAGRQAVAIQHYQAAAKLDPSYFHAYYHQGLAAYQTADWQHSLYSYEVALAIQPDHADAHFNFCLALKQANYPLDAVNELQKLLQAHPDHDGAHLTLGNLYSQQFNDFKKARIHYSKVLELKPRHPEAARIRYWLAANP